MGFYLNKLQVVEAKLLLLFHEIMSGRVSDEERSEVSKTPIQQLSDAEDDDAKSEAADSEAGSGNEEAGSGDEDAGSGDEDAVSGDEDAGSGDEDAASGDEGAGVVDEGEDGGSERAASPEASDVDADDAESVNSAADQKSIVSAVSDAVATVDDKLKLEEYDGELQEAADQVREAISDEADAVVAAKDDAIAQAADLVDKETDEAMAELAETIEVPEVIPPTAADISSHLPTLAEEDVPAIPNQIPEAIEEEKIVEDIKTKIEQPLRKLSASSLPLPGATDASAAVEKSGWKKVFFCCN